MTEMCERTHVHTHSELNLGRKKKKKGVNITEKLKGGPFVENQFHRMTKVLRSDGERQKKR